MPGDSFPPAYREIPPAPYLASAVECIWVSTAHSNAKGQFVYRVLPDGCMDLLFDFMAVGNRQVSVIGTMTRPLIVTTTGSVDLLGIRFRPGGLSRFLVF